MAAVRSAARSARITAPAPLRSQFSAVRVARRADRLQDCLHLAGHVPGPVRQQNDSAPAQTAPGTKTFLIKLVLDTALTAHAHGGQPGAVSAGRRRWAGRGDQAPLLAAAGALSTAAQRRGVERVADGALGPGRRRRADLAAMLAGRGCLRGAGRAYRLAGRGKLHARRRPHTLPPRASGHCDPRVEGRPRSACFLARLPQAFIEHHRRVPGRELSRNITWQPGLAQLRTLDIASETDRSRASLATSARSAATGSSACQLS
jgi:hypothetical protein